jgi:protein SCO1/2
VGVDEHLGARVPLDVVLRDHEGHAVQVGQYFDRRRPVILDLAYYHCPMLCSMVITALVNGLRQTSWTAGNQFDVVTISIDPREGPAQARQKRERVLEEYGRGPAEHGWHFLTGDQTSVRRIADAVGFHYHYDPRQNEYAHPAAIFLLTPDGHIARYLYGIQFNPNDLRLGLIEASEGRSVSTVDRLIMFCYHYDPQGRRYAIVATRIMQLGAVVTIILLGGMLTVFWARERRRKRSAVDSHGDSTHSPLTDVRS